MDGLRAYPTDRCCVLYLCHYCTLGTETKTEKNRPLSKVSIFLYYPCKTLQCRPNQRTKDEQIFDEQ